MANRHLPALLAATVFVLVAPTAEAQGIVRGAQKGAEVGERKAGKPGKVVGAVVGGVAGGVAGGVKGVLGIPQETGTTKPASRTRKKVSQRRDD